MKKRPILLTLVLLCLLTFCFSSSTLARYIEKLEGKPIQVTINGRTYTNTPVTADNLQYSCNITNDGTVTINQYFFAPDTETEDPDDKKWYVTDSIAANAFAANAFNDNTVTSITIPTFITSIEDYALSSSTLMAISVETGHTAFKMVGNDLYDYSGTKLIRHIKTGKTWHSVPENVTAIQPGAFSNSGYTAIVTTLYDNSGNAWGAGPAIMIDDTELLSEITAITGDVNNGYTITLEQGTDTHTQVVYRKKVDPVNENSLSSNSVLDISNNTIQIPQEVCQPCEHNNYPILILVSYQTHAYGYLYTDNNGETVLELHNCDTAITPEGTLHQIKNYSTGEHQDIALTEIYNLPSGLPPGVAAVPGAKAWSELPASSITKVIVVDAITPTSMENWFTDFSALETLEIKKPLGNAGGTLGSQYSNSGLDKVSLEWSYDGGESDSKIVVTAENLPIGTPGTYKADFIYCYATTSGTSPNIVLRIYQRKYVPSLNENFNDGNESYTVTGVYSWRAAEKNTTYTVTPGCRPPKDASGTVYSTWGGNTTPSQIGSVKVVDNIAPETTKYWFYNFVNCQSYNLSKLNTSNVQDMSNMFYSYSTNNSLVELDLSSFNTANVTNMAHMFRNLGALSKIVVSDKFVTASVTTHNNMFTKCTALVGGNGTSFSTSHTNKTYARIDGNNGLRGYFTAANDVTVNYANVTVQVAEGAPFTWTEGKGSFANQNQHHFFTGEDNTIILKTADSTLYSGNVVINNGEPVEVTDGQLTLSAGLVTEGATITLSAAAETQLLEDGGLTYLTATCDPAEIVLGEAFTIILTPDAGYILPDTVTIAINGTEKTEADGVTYNTENGVITIPGGLVTEGITISVTAEGKQQISVTTVFASELTVTCNPTVPIPGEIFTVTLTGETLPDGVTVSIDHTEATTAVYDKAAGTITIPGDLLANNTKEIAVTAVNSDDVTPVVCNCTAQCGEDATNSDCPVCGTTPENCSPVTCTCETLYTEDAKNSECTICAGGGACMGGTGNEEDPDTDPVLDEGDGENAGDDNATESDNTDDADATDPVPDSDEGEPETPVITVTTDIVGLTFTPDAAPAVDQDYTGTLTANEGYTLPESITVTIGEATYTVDLSGENADGAPDYDPETSKLTVPGDLLTESTSITIKAEGAQVSLGNDEDGAGEDPTDPEQPENPTMEDPDNDTPADDPDTDTPDADTPVTPSTEDATLPKDPEDEETTPDDATDPVPEE